MKKYKSIKASVGVDLDLFTSTNFVLLSPTETLLLKRLICGPASNSVTS